jgi:hypothetical protein
MTFPALYKPVTDVGSQHASSLVYTGANLDVRKPMLIPGVALYRSDVAARTAQVPASTEAFVDGLPQLLFGALLANYVSGRPMSGLAQLPRSGRGRADTYPRGFFRRPNGSSQQSKRSKFAPQITAVTSVYGNAVLVHIYWRENRRLPDDVFAAEFQAQDSAPGWQVPHDFARTPPDRRAADAPNCDGRRRWFSARPIPVHFGLLMPHVAAVGWLEFLSLRAAAGRRFKRSQVNLDRVL